VQWVWSQWAVGTRFIISFVTFVLFSNSVRKLEGHRIIRPPFCILTPVQQGIRIFSGVSSNWQLIWNGLYEFRNRISKLLEIWLMCQTAWYDVPQTRTKYGKGAIIETLMTCCNRLAELWKISLKTMPWGLMELYVKVNLDMHCSELSTSAR
jgi:hypothetical protein